MKFSYHDIQSSKLILYHVWNKGYVWFYLKTGIYHIFAAVLQLHYSKQTETEQHKKKLRDINKQPNRKSSH